MRVRVVVAVALLASCTAAPGRGSPPTPAEGATRSTASPAPGVARSHESPANCPVTVPNGDSPPGQRSRSSHGNGRIWVVLWWPHGIIRAREDDVQPDGSLAIKFPWTRGVAGRLTITGRRLDAEAPPVRAWIPDGYGRRGFQSTAVIFPTAGCWEVTGRVGGTSLTVVVNVLGPSPISLPCVGGAPTRLVGARHHISGEVFGWPLRAPPDPGRANKILWRTRRSGGGDLMLSASLNGAALIVHRRVEQTMSVGTAMPSIINVPRAGCWTFSLRWGRQRDVVAVRYSAPG